MRNEGKKGRYNGVMRWCSEQSNGCATPERRKFRRVHGLQFPLHPQQVTGWIVILIIVINTFAVLTPHLEPNSRSILTLVIAAIFVTHISSHLAVLLMDPADPRIRSQPANKILPEFDRDKHLHVIENGRCHLCNITTDSRRTKHCSICNKCIVRFDHHCKWLNNCIGARNYSAFLVCLISAILANLFVAGLSATELSFCLIPDRFANYIGANGANRFNGANGTNGTNGTVENTENTAKTLIASVADTATIVVMFAIGVLSALAAILLLHLCFFHGYIACLGLTTYEYVRKKREKNSGRPIRDAVDLRSNPTAIHEHASVRCCFVCVALPLRKSATVSSYPFRIVEGIVERGNPLEGKAIRCSVPYRENERVSRNTRLRLSVPRWCSNVVSNRDQSTNLPVRTRTNSNVSAGLPTSSANLRSCSSVQLVHDAMHCCSMLSAVGGSKKRPNGDSTARVSTNACATVQRVRTLLRAYLGNGERRRCAEQRSHESTVANGDSSGEIATAFPANCIVPSLTGPFTDPPDNLHRLQKTFGSSTHGRLLITRTCSRKLKSHMPQSAKLSPILESELSTPDTPLDTSQSSNSSQPISPLRIDRFVSSSPEM